MSWCVCPAPRLRKAPEPALTTDRRRIVGPPCKPRKATMLVLSRHCEEAIMIGDDVEIVIVDIRGDKVRLGVNAPARVAVHRKEIYESIREENAQAASLRGVLGSLPGAPSMAHQRAAAIASIAAARISA